MATTMVVLEDSSPHGSKSEGQQAEVREGVSKNHAMNTAKVSILLDVLLSHEGPKGNKTDAADPGKVGDAQQVVPHAGGRTSLAPATAKLALRGDERPAPAP